MSAGRAGGRAARAHDATHHCEAGEDREREPGAGDGRDLRDPGFEADGHAAGDGAGDDTIRVKRRLLLRDYECRARSV
jgi:hypothetical protein